MEASGAAKAVARTDVNKEDWPLVNKWLDAVCQVVLAAPLKTAAEMGIVADAAAHKAPSKRWGKARPYYARVAAVQGLCQLSSKDDKETVRVELDLGDSGLQYLPGDALGIYASNSPQVGSGSQAAGSTRWAAARDVWVGFDVWMCRGGCAGVALRMQVLHPAAALRSALRLQRSPWRARPAAPLPRGPLLAGASGGKSTQLAQHGS
jgi:hypothetical protein